MVPEPLGGQGRLIRSGQSAPQRGLREPVPHGSLADRFHGPVHRRNGEVLPDAQSLPPLRASSIGVQGHFLSLRFQPHGGRQSELEHFRILRGRPAVDRLGNVLQLAQVLLP